MSNRPVRRSLRFVLISLCMALTFGFFPTTAEASFPSVTTGSSMFRTALPGSDATIDPLASGEMAGIPPIRYPADQGSHAALLLSGSSLDRTLPVTGLLITTGSVNFRSGPSTSYSVIRNLSQGTVVELLSVYNSYWYKVRHNGTTGYLSPKYVTAYQEAPSLGTYVTTGSVNFRTGPSTSYSVIRKLSAGQLVELLAIHNSYWYKVRHNGTTGYLSPKYITPWQEPTLQPGTLSYKGTGIAWYNSFSYDEMKKYPTTHTARIAELLDQRKAVLIGPNFSAADGYSNYLAGHNPGILSPLVAIGVGDTFSATDSSGRTTTYVVTDKATGTTRTGASQLIGPSGKKVFDYYFWGVAEECIVIQFCTGADAIAVFYAVPAR